MVCGLFCAENFLRSGANDFHAEVAKVSQSSQLRLKKTVDDALDAFFEEDGVEVD